MANKGKKSTNKSVTKQPISKSTTPKLSATNLKKLDKQFKEQKEVIVQSTNNPELQFKLKIDTKFRNTKISAFFVELQEKINYCKLNNINIDETIWVLYPILLIKHFTDVTIPKKIEEQIHLSEQLVDNELLAPVLEKFPEDQLEIVSEKIKQVIANTDLFTTMMADEVLKEDFKIENEDVLQMKEWAKKIKEHDASDDDKLIN